MHRTTVQVTEGALDANQTIARENRADFDARGVTVINLMSAPGAGKGTLLERALEDTGDVRVGVLEGDVRSLDADRPRTCTCLSPRSTPTPLRRRVPPRRQHGPLAIGRIPLDEIDLLVIENVGNLVCPAEFTVGEHHRWMISSVTEGDDKPLKYPLMFRTCPLVVINKIDLPHVDFSIDRFLANLDQVNPDAETLQVSARTGRGIEAWRRRMVTTLSHG